MGNTLLQYLKSWGIRCFNTPLFCSPNLVGTPLRTATGLTSDPDTGWHSTKVLKYVCRNCVLPDLNCISETPPPPFSPQRWLPLPLLLSASISSHLATLLLHPEPRYVTPSLPNNMTLNTPSPAFITHAPFFIRMPRMPRFLQCHPHCSSPLRTELHQLLRASSKYCLYVHPHF